MSKQINFTLREQDIPTQWYNLLADFPEPMPPPLHPGTRQPVPPEALLAIFPENLVNRKCVPSAGCRFPKPVRDIYALWRPTPLLRAVRLEKALKRRRTFITSMKASARRAATRPTPPSPRLILTRLPAPNASRPKPARASGVRRWRWRASSSGWNATSTWSRSATTRSPTAGCSCTPGARRCIASPSDQTEYGRKLLAEDPHCPGSLGIAISEAIEDTVTHPNTKYSLGSVLNHVCLHQTVIGEESIKQMEMAGEEPDVIFGCCGGGSNFAGLAFPFMRKKITEKKKYRMVGVEPSACPSLTQGRAALRLWRHGGNDAVDEDVHARPRFHAAVHSRGRAALPRHVADGQPRAQAGPDRSRGLPPDQGFRGRRHFSRRRRALCRRRNPRTRSPRWWTKL